MIKVKINQEQMKLLESGNKIETDEGIYYNWPYWAKKNGEEDLYEIYKFCELPHEFGYKKGGLEKSKYLIRKADGTPVDPEAWYFVLRVDKDPHAQQAAIRYAQSVEQDNPLLAKELMERVKQFNPDI